MATTAIITSEFQRRFVRPVVRINGHETDMGPGQLIPNCYLEPASMTFDPLTSILTVGGRSVFLGENQDTRYLDANGVLVPGETKLVTLSNLMEMLQVTSSIASGLMLVSASSLPGGISIKLDIGVDIPSGLRLSTAGLAIHATDAFNLIQPIADGRYAQIGNIPTGPQLVAGYNITLTPIPGNQLVISANISQGTVTSVTLNPWSITYLADSGATGKKVHLLASVNGVEGELTPNQLDTIFRNNTALFAALGFPLIVKNINSGSITGPDVFVFIGQANSVYNFGSGNGAGPFVPILAMGEVVTGIGSPDNSTGPNTLDSTQITATSHPQLFAELNSPAKVAIYRNGVLARIAGYVAINTTLPVEFGHVPLSGFDAGRIQHYIPAAI